MANSTAEAPSRSRLKDRSSRIIRNVTAFMADRLMAGVRGGCGREWLVAEHCRRHKQTPVAVDVGEIVSEQRNIDRPLIVQRHDFNLAWRARAVVQLGLVDLSICQRQIVVDRGEVVESLDVDIDTAEAIEQPVDAA